MCHYAPLHQTIKYLVDRYTIKKKFVIFLSAKNLFICNEFE